MELPLWNRNLHMNLKNLISYFEVRRRVRRCRVKCIQMTFTFFMKHPGLMLHFIALVEVLIGYFKTSILANLKVLWTEKHIGSICTCPDVWEWLQRLPTGETASNTLGSVTWTYGKML